VPALLLPRRKPADTGDSEGAAAAAMMH
jgi:hypothetical protein